MSRKGDVHPMPGTVEANRLVLRSGADREGSLPEDRLAAIIAKAGHARGLDDVALRGVWRRLNTDRSQRRSRAPIVLPSLRWVVGLGIVLFSSGVIAGLAARSGQWPLFGPFATPEPPTTSLATARAPRPRPLHHGPRAAAAEIAPTPAATPVAAPPVVPAPAPVAAPPASARHASPARVLAHADPIRAAPPAPRAPEPPPPALSPPPVAFSVAAERPIADPHAVVRLESPLAAESALLSRALVRLRQDRDGLAALTELDSYTRRFPAGVLAREAAVARVDALLLLGRAGQARTALEGLTLAPRGRDIELLLIRGELRAASDCRRALSDFDAVLSAPAHPAGLDERALYGRAACRAQLGDEPGARRDLDDYLMRFPEGRFAGSIRRRPVL